MWTQWDRQDLPGTEAGRACCSEVGEQFFNCTFLIVLSLFTVELSSITAELISHKTELCDFFFFFFYIDLLEGQLSLNWIPGNFLEGKKWPANH